MKLCIKCNILKEEILFSKRGQLRGYGNTCKECTNLYRKTKIILNVTVLEWKCYNCDAIKPSREFNRSKRTPQGIVHICRECQSNLNKIRYKKDSEIIKSKTSTYYYENKEKRRKYARKYQKEKMEHDPMYKLTRRLRCRLYDALNCTEWAKHSSFRDYIGCKLPELKKHFELLFKDGMNWENMGQWHIDHIVPLSSAKTEQELYELCHYTNLQPLWAIDNLKKGDKY